MFLPLAHVLARALSMTAFANGVTIGYTSDIRIWFRCSGCSSRP